MADSTSQLTTAQKDELMDQVKQQIAIANAQELLTVRILVFFSYLIILNWPSLKTPTSLQCLKIFYSSFSFSVSFYYNFSSSIIICL